MRLEPRAGFGVQGQAGWARHVSGQAERFQGHQSHSGSALLMGRLAQERLLLGPRNVFQQKEEI